MATIVYSWSKLVFGINNPINTKNNNKTKTASQRPAAAVSDVNNAMQYVHVKGSVVQLYTVYTYIYICISIYICIRLYNNLGDSSQWHAAWCCTNSLRCGSSVPRTTTQYRTVCLASCRVTSYVHYVHSTITMTVQCPDVSGSLWEEGHKV